MESANGPSELPEQQQSKESKPTLVETWRARIDSVKANAAAATMSLGLPPEKTIDVMAIMYGAREDQADSEIQKSLELVDALRSEVEEMEREAKEAMERNALFAENEDHAVEIIYGDTGIALLSLYRSKFGK